MKIGKFSKNLSRLLVVGKAKFWKVTIRSSDWLHRVFLIHGLRFAILSLFVLAVISLYFSENLYHLMQEYYSFKLKSGSVSTLMSAVGPALIGSSAIAFSFIMFAMQVNVDRVPYGLFRRLSSDFTLLAYFITTAFISIAISVLPLFEDHLFVGQSLLIGFWGAATILFLYVLAYRRALSLINPISQINYLISNSHRHMATWNKRATRLVPLLESNQESEDEPSKFSLHGKPDIARAAFFTANPDWMTEAAVSVEHAMSMARTYSERGDHQISQAALNAVVLIHRSYVHARGKTFFTDNLLVENPLSRENFLSETLEHLRQNISSGLKRGDEQQLEQTFRVMGGLAIAYSNADFSESQGIKSSPGLAARYLSSAVIAAIPHKMPDVLMEGAIQMGTAARHVISITSSDQKNSTLDKLFQLSVVGVAVKDYRPVTLTCTEQLAVLLFDVIRSDTKSNRMVIQQIRENMNRLAIQFLDVPDELFSGPHSTYLAPYFSSTKTDTFLTNMHTLANALIEIEDDNGNYISIMENLNNFADESYRGVKDVLLKSIEKRSSFSSDIIHWVTTISKLLNAISASPAAKSHRDELLKSSSQLFAALTWLPSDQDSIDHAKLWGASDATFETVADAVYRLEFDDAQQFVDVLIGWVFKAGKENEHYLVEGLLSLVVVAAMSDGVVQKHILGKIAGWVTDSGSSEAYRETITTSLREKVRDSQRETFRIHEIESAISALPNEAVTSVVELMCVQFSRSS